MKQPNYFAFMSKIDSLTNEEIDSMSETEAKNILREYIIQNKRSGEDKFADAIAASGDLISQGTISLRNRMRSVFKK